MTEPYTDSEIEMLMWQTPINDSPNEGANLPAEETNENQPELSL